MSNRAVKDKIYEVAKSAIFWEPPQCSPKDAKDINVLVQIHSELSRDDMREPWMKDFRIFSGFVARPALPEIDVTPTATKHEVLLDKPIKIVVAQEHTSMIRACQISCEFNLFACFTECDIQETSKHLILLTNNMRGGMAIWSDGTKPVNHRCAELFAGGFGGWSFAMKASEKLMKDPFTCEIAIDCDACMTAMFSANHDGHLVSNKEDFRGPIAHGEKTMVFTTMIQDSQWFHWAAIHAIDIYVASPPCPAWSEAGDGLGFLRVDGQQTIHLAKVCRLNQPKVVMLENVKGFKSNAQFSLTIALFRWAGYRLHDHIETDLGDVSPAKRKRWFGTFVRNDLQVFPAVHEWFQAYNFTLENFAFDKLNHPDEIIRACTLDDEMLDIYGDRRLLPHNSGFKPNAAHDRMDVCYHRFVKPTGKFGVFMAMYGRQHFLPPSTLMKNRLFAELMPATDGEVRFVTPVEEALCYMTETCMLPKDIHVAFAALGNAISPPQAAYVLHMLDTILGKDVSITPMDMVMNMIKDAMRPDKVAIHDCGDFWKIEPVTVATICDSPGSVQSPPSKRTRCELEDVVNQHEESDQPCQITPTCQWPEQHETTLVALEEHEMKDIEWVNLTLLMPFNIMNLRIHKGSDIRQILHEHGFQSDFCKLTDVFTGDAVSDDLVVKDSVYDVTFEHDVEPTPLKTLMAQEMDFFRMDCAESGQQWTTVSIVYHGKQIWSGLLPAETELQLIHGLTSRAFQKVGIRCDLRWVHLGRGMNPYWGWKLNTMTHAGSVKLHVFLPTIGGGGNKMEEDVKNQLVALLASHAIPFTNLMSSVAQMCYKHKVTTIKKALQNQDKEQRWKEIQDLAREAGVHLRNENKEEAARKIQRVVKRKGFTQQVEIDVSAVRLLPGAFLNQDGSDAQILNQGFSVNGHGVVLTTLSEVEPWVMASRHLNSDEFCAIIPGHHTCETKLTMQHIQCQGIQPDSSPLLFKATMIQFGEKKITQAKIPEAKVDCPKSMVMAMTVHKDELESQWNMLIQRPAKHILSLFNPEVQEKAVVAVWGQRFQCEGVRCSPAKSDSIQFHCRVREDWVKTVLRESGHNCVYVIPKDETLNKPDAKFSIIWIGAKRFDAELQAKDYNASLGIVRNKKMYGYRIDYDDFSDAWTHSFPNRELPRQVKVQKLFKLLNVPAEFTQNEVGKWLEGLYWNAKAIKRLGAGSWLIGAEKEPPQAACKCNDQVILIQSIQAKHANQPNQVLAGRPIVPKDTVKQTENRGQDPLQTNDAWAQFRERQGMTTQASDKTKPAVQREIEGPTAARLSAQDQKIDQINQRLADFEAKATSAIQGSNAELVNVRETMKQQEQKIDTMEKRVDSRMKTYQQQTENKLAQVQGAVEAASKANNDQFRIIRELLQGATAVSSDELPHKTVKRTPNASPRTEEVEGGNKAAQAAS